MKLTLLSLLLAVTFSFSISQEIVSTRLSDHLNNISKEEFFTVRISFSDYVDCFELKHQMVQQGIPVEERGSIVISKLQEKQSTVQKEVLNHIYNDQGLYSEVKSFWIVNMISVKTNKEGLNQLLSFGEIDRIDLNHDTLSPLEFKIEKSDEENRSINDVEPGLEVINVRPLWEMGYTGRGQVAYSYDTGVWPDHPSIKDNYMGNYVPQEEAYYGYWSELPNGNISSHGTHTIGTMMGLDANTNDTIGVAWNSYFIANDLVTSTVEELPPIDEMVLAFEWALNPDGDINTSHDIPTVINNSWRWYDDPDTMYCNGFVVELMNALEAAGIALVFSGGNHGPINTTISSPQRINTSIVNTFSVGSINANDPLLPISSFSSRGPKQCPATGDSSLLIHPEVVAPGQSVRSAWGSDSYNSISGTSMASPHVSGVVLLLKEAFPIASGEEILTAIYFTAVDMGETGEDNIFGMGLIDAYAAFQYLSLSYTPAPPVSGTDIKFIGLNGVSNYYCQSEIDYTVDIKNDGDTTLYNINVQYGTVNTPNIGMLSIDSIQAFDTHTLMIPTHTISELGNVDLLVEFSLSFNDIDTVNNRRVYRTNFRPTQEALPFIEQFEPNVFEEVTWYSENPDLDVSWDTTNFISGIQFSEASIYIPFSFDVMQNAEDGLISPIINLPNDQDSLSLDFKHCYQHKHTALSDSLEVLISNDCGVSWTRVFYYGGSDLSTAEENENNFFPSSIDHWQENHVNISDFAGQNVLIKFRGKNRRGNNVFLDDIFVYGNEEPSSIEFSKYEFNVAPNPFKNIFNIQTNYQGKVNYSLYAIDGKELEITISGFTILTNQLSDGVYFLKIDTEMGSKYIKIVCFNN